MLILLLQRGGRILVDSNSEGGFSSKSQKYSFPEICVECVENSCANAQKVSRTRFFSVFKSHPNVVAHSHKLVIFCVQIAPQRRCALPQTCYFLCSKSAPTSLRTRSFGLWLILDDPWPIPTENYFSRNLRRVRRKLMCQCAKSFAHSLFQCVQIAPQRRCALSQTCYFLCSNRAPTSLPAIF